MLSVRMTLRLGGRCRFGQYRLPRLHRLICQQDGSLFLGCPFRRPGHHLTPRHFRRQPSLVLSPKELVGDVVHGATNVSHRFGQMFPPGPELLDLRMEHLAASGQIGQGAGAERLGLVDHVLALGASLGDERLRLFVGPVSELCQ